MPRKLKWNDAELARMAKQDRSYVCQQIKQKYPSLYLHLKEGLRIHCLIENGDKEKFTPIYNNGLSVFCLSHNFCIEFYHLLLYSGVEKVEELLDTEDLLKKWDEYKDYLSTEHGYMNGFKDGADFMMERIK